MEGIMDFDKDKIISGIRKLSNAKVLVVGDLALDEMIYGDAERISREAPVLILQHTNTKLILGGASNAAHNVSTLNLGKVGAIGVYGDDYYGKKLLEILEEKLSQEELDLARRGRNLSIPSARRSNQNDYRQATAFEVLIGWWYVNDKLRLEMIKSFLKDFL